MNIEIRHGHIIDASQKINKHGSLYIDNNKIIALFKKPDYFNAEKIIDASGQIVCAGFIELSAHLREPGQSHKATIQSETYAAASAGFTRLCLPPSLKSPIDTPAIVELIKDKAEQCGYPYVYPIAALTQKLAGQQLSALYHLKKTGCIAVSNVQAPLQNLLVLRRAMEYAATHDLLLMYYPQEPALSFQGCVHEGVMASRYGLPSIPIAAETIALMQCIELMEQTGCRVHIRGLSCARSVSLIKKAKKDRLPITADVTMHQLHLTDQDMIPYDSHYHVLPPLRSAYDKNALLKGLKDNIIDCICSDHQPHDIDAKLGAFPETEPGISSLETTLPLLLRLINQGYLTLDKALTKINSSPAATLGLNTGNLLVGQSADICIFNPKKQWTIDNNTWYSQGKNTPYWGQSMLGKVSYTLQAGKIIYQEDKHE